MKEAITCTPKAMTPGSMDMGKFMMLNSDSDTKALFESRILVSEESTKVAKEPRATCNETLNLMLQFGIQHIVIICFMVNAIHSDQSVIYWQLISYFISNILKSNIICNRLIETDYSQLQ